MTQIKLATALPIPSKRTLSGRYSMTQVKLAHCPGAQGDNAILDEGQDSVLSRTDPHPSLLVAYPYVGTFLKRREQWRMRDWSLDSGAFSADSRGLKIDHQEYIDFALKLQEEDDLCTEIFSLDVIKNWEESAKNVEEEWRQGLRSIPAYHIGEPEEALLHLANTYPKIALGGVARKKPSFRLRWAKECFARVWPKAIHGFGFGDREAILTLPFHSVDSSSWELGPCGFGNWKSYRSPGKKLTWKGSDQDLRAEIAWFLDLEQEAQKRWEKELETVSVKLAIVGHASGPRSRLLRSSSDT